MKRVFNIHSDVKGSVSTVQWCEMSEKTKQKLIQTLKKEMQAAWSVDADSWSCNLRLRDYYNNMRRNEVLKSDAAKRRGMRKLRKLHAENWVRLAYYCIYTISLYF